MYCYVSFEITFYFIGVVLCDLYTVNIVLHWLYKTKHLW